jgi:hypothetical protein
MIDLNINFYTSLNELAHIFENVRLSPHVMLIKFSLDN